MLYNAPHVKLFLEANTYEYLATYQYQKHAYQQNADFAVLDRQQR